MAHLVIHNIKIMERLHRIGKGNRDRPQFDSRFDIIFLSSSSSLSYILVICLTLHLVFITEGIYFQTIPFIFYFHTYSFNNMKVLYFPRKCHKIKDDIEIF